MHSIVRKNYSYRRKPIISKNCAVLDNIICSDHDDYCLLVSEKLTVELKLKVWVEILWEIFETFGGFAGGDGSEAIATTETLDVNEKGRVGQDKYQAAFKIALQKSPSEIIDSLVPCFVCIHDDDFGIDSALKLGSTLKTHQESEVFVNHSDLIQGSYRDIGISPRSDLSRFTSRYREAAKNLFKETVNFKEK